MRLYTINEVFGPVKCEIPEIGKDKCGKTAWTFILSKYEDSILVINSGPEATQQIFQQSLGTAICNHHLDLLFDRNKTKTPVVDVHVGPQIKISGIKERRFNIIDDAQNKAKKQIEQKVGENLLFMRCHCGYEFIFNEDGIIIKEVDRKKIYESHIVKPEKKFARIMLNASFSIRCLCGEMMTGTFMKFLDT